MTATTRRMAVAIEPGDVLVIPGTGGQTVTVERRQLLTPTGDMALMGEGRTFVTHAATPWPVAS